MTSGESPRGRRVVIRPRRDADLTVLESLLAQQQPVTGYPVTWPLAGPVSDFLVREDEVAAWVAEADGEVAGHVSVTRVGSWGALWADALGVDVDALGCVSTLFVGLPHSGTGVGTALLDHAVAHVRDRNLVPVLDVVPGNGRALRFYERRGWHTVARGRLDWLPDHCDDLHFMALDVVHGSQLPAEVREHSVAKAAVLMGVLRVMNNPEPLARAIAACHSQEQDLREAVQQAYRLTPIQTTAVLDLQARRFTARQRQTIEDELRQIDRLLNGWSWHRYCA